MRRIDGRHPAWDRLLALVLVLGLLLAAAGVAEDVGAPVIEPVDTEVTEIEALELALPADGANDPGANALPTKLTLGVKETFSFKVSGAKRYETSDKKVAAVSKKGVITAKAVGKAMITALDKKGKKVKDVAVTVKKAPNKVTVKPKEKTLEVGGKVTLKASLPSKTASYRIDWSSSDKAVASVSASGEVKALKAGTAIITARAFNGKKGACAITVVEPVTPPNALVKKYLAASGLTIDGLVAVSGKSVEALNEMNTRYFTELEVGTDGVKWRMQDDSWEGVFVVGYDGTPSSLTLQPAYGNGLPVKEIREGAFKGNQSLTKLVIAEGVASLPGYCFEYCPMLSDVTFPSTLTNPGYKGFGHCGTEVAGTVYYFLPDGLTSESATFEANSAVLVCAKGSATALLLSDHAYDITFPGEYDFRYRYQDQGRTDDGLQDRQVILVLKSYVGAGGAVNIPQGAVYIDNNAFKDNAAITGVTIPESVLRIRDDAFNGCVNLTDVSFPSALKSIGVRAFAQCGRNLTTPFYFDLPDNLLNIIGNGGGAHTFQDCNAILRVRRDTQSARLLSERDYNITFPGEEDFRYRYEQVDVNGVKEYKLFLWNYVGSAAQVAIPSVYGIGSSKNHDTTAFRNNKTITKVVIPDGTVVVRDYAFCDCAMLTDVTFPSSLTSLLSHAFQNCGNSSGARYYYVLPGGITTMYTMNWSAGWDTFQDSKAVLVAPAGSSTCELLAKGTYIHYHSLEAAQSGDPTLAHDPRDDKTKHYNGSF